MEPRYNEDLYKEVLGITNDLFCPSNSKIYEKGPHYSEHIFAIPLALHEIKVPLYSRVNQDNFNNSTENQPILL